MWLMVTLVWSDYVILALPILALVWLVYELCRVAEAIKKL